MTDAARPAARACRPPTCPSTAAARSPTSTTPACPRSTGSAARRWRRTPAPTASTRPRSRSLLQMENDLVGFACDLLDAPDTAVGTVTSGGTESCLLAVQAARDAGPTSSGPRMVRARRPCTRPSTRPRTTSASRRSSSRSAPDFRADAGRDGRGDRRPDDRARRRPARRRTPTASSTRCTELAAAAAERGIRCHVDACIGGWVLPYAARLGRTCRRGRSRSTASPRSRSTCTSTPTPPRAPRCCCTATPELRRPQYFASRRLAGLHDAQLDDAVDEVRRPARRRLGGRAVARRRGLPRRSPAQVFEAVDRIVAGVDDVPALSLVAAPRLDPGRARHRRLAATRSRSATRWPRAAGTSSRRCRTPASRPTIHLSVSAATLAARRRVPRPRWRVGRRPRAAGPVAVDPGVVAFIEALDPAALTDADFDGLLAAVRAGRRSADGARPARAGWPRSTRCSTSPRPRCARRCWSRSSTGCSDRRGLIRQLRRARRRPSGPLDQAP